jgi:hypothetical protein
MDDWKEQRDGVSSLKAQYGEDIFASQREVYLIAKDWWEDWTAFTNNTQAKPGPIDNSSLVEDISESPPVLRSSFDPSEAEFVSLSVWLCLVYWYGGGPQIEVFVIEGVPDYTPLRIYVSKIESDFDIESTSFLVSKFISVKRLKRYLTQRMSVPFYKYELLLSELDRERSLENYEDFCLADVGVEANSKVVLRRTEDKPKIVISSLEVPQDQDTDSASMHSSGEIDHHFESIRTDCSEVQEKLVTALQHATNRLKVRSLRRIQQSLMRQSKAYEAWLRPS